MSQTPPYPPSPYGQSSNLYPPAQPAYTTTPMPQPAPAASSPALTFSSELAPSGYNIDPTQSSFTINGVPATIAKPSGLFSFFKDSLAWFPDQNQWGKFTKGDNNTITFKTAYTQGGARRSKRRRLTKRRKSRKTRMGRRKRRSTTKRF